MRTPIKLSLLYTACVLLVLIYINTFQLWAWMVKQLGASAAFLPLIVVLIFLTTIFGYFFKKYRAHNLNYRLFFAGILVCVVTVCIPNPAVPIKRIHVPEYMLLSFLVRYTLSQRIAGRELAWFTALVTALFGIHDEVIQGLHPLRTYGLADMSVNGLAGLGGTLLGQAVGLFTASVTHEDSRSLTKFRRHILWFGGIVLAGILTLVLPLPGYKGSPEIPVRFILPLLIAVLSWPLTGFLQNSPPRYRHGLYAVFWLSFLLIIHPIIVNTTSIIFF